MPAGETIGACDGLNIDTVLPDQSGAPPIDYHQIELPLGGRKPLPFITNKVLSDKRVTDAAALVNAAKVLTSGSPDTAERFSRAARMMAAAGGGRSTVAALRGDRSAAPSFGSLADDLVLTPAAVSPTVTPVVVDRTPPVARRFAPLVKSIVGVPLSLTLDRPGVTTVADAGSAVAGVTPTLASVRAANASRTQAVLTVVPRAAAPVGKSIGAVGVVPVTRLASGPLAAVANARPTPAAAARMAGLSGGLVGPGATGDATGGGAVVHDGELVVITVASRPLGETLDTLSVSGGPTRVLCLAAGGRAIEDQVLQPGNAPGTVELPRETERVAVVGIGSTPAAGGTIPGWCAGLSLPSIGWGAALAGGAVVTAQATRISDNRERADGGWVVTAELATAAQVVTVFTDPVDVVAIVIDDYLGGDAAAAVSMRLLDATRQLDEAGGPRPPEVMVVGVRSILLYAVTTTGPEPGVLVDGCGGGQLAGVLGGTGGIDSMAAALAVTGVEASVQQPLVGGPGQRQVAVALGDGPIPAPVVPADTKPRTAKPRTAKPRTAKKTTGSPKSRRRT